MADEAKLVIELADKSGSPGSATTAPGNPGSAVVPGANVANDFQNRIGQGAGNNPGQGSAPAPFPTAPVGPPSAPASSTPSASVGDTPQQPTIGSLAETISGIYAAVGGNRILGQVAGPVGQAVGNLAQVALREAWRLDPPSSGTATTTNAPTSAPTSPPSAASNPIAPVGTASTEVDPLLNATRGILAASPQTTADELAASMGVSADRATALINATKMAQTAASTLGATTTAAVGAPVAAGIVGTVSGGAVAPAATGVAASTLGTTAIVPPAAAGTSLLGGLVASGGTIAAGVGVVAAAAMVPVAAGMAAMNEAERARSLTPYSPDALLASAEAGVRQISATLETSRRLGDEVGRYIDATSRIGTSVQSIRDIASEPVLQKLDDILEAVAKLAEYGEFIAESKVGVFAIQALIESYIRQFTLFTGPVLPILLLISQYLPSLDKKDEISIFQWFQNWPHLPAPTPFTSGGGEETPLDPTFVPSSVPGLRI